MWCIHKRELKVLDINTIMAIENGDIMASFHVLRTFYDYYEMKECWEGNGYDTKTSFTTFLLDPRKVVMHYILILNWLHGLASV